MSALAGGTASLQWIRIGSYVAGAINVFGILLVSRGFTNAGLAQAYPEYFGAGGCFLILLWGCAYIAAARAEVMSAAMFLVFAVEKLFYTGTWFTWFPDNMQLVADMLGSDPGAALFLYTYWANDLLWALFFGVAAWRLLREAQGRV